MPISVVFVILLLVLVVVVVVVVFLAFLTSCFFLFFPSMHRRSHMTPNHIHTNENKHELARRAISLTISGADDDGTDRVRVFLWLCRDGCICRIIICARRPPPEDVCCRARWTGRGPLWWHLPQHPEHERCRYNFREQVVEEVPQRMPKDIKFDVIDEGIHLHVVVRLMRVYEVTGRVHTHVSV